MRLLNIIIADDHPIYRDGLEQAVRRLKVADRIYQASNGLEVIERFQANPVDLIFMDVRMPQLSGFDTTNHLRVIDQEVKIIIVSMLEDKNQILRLFNAGINGFMHKNTDHRKLARIIEMVMADIPYISDEVKEYYDEGIAEGKIKRDRPEVVLSLREVEILQLICKQLSTKEIADRLHLNEKQLNRTAFIS
jgi:DNA-binding NarL/FixJ family response regulator